MSKVIAKLHANGNFETVGVQLVQGGNAYSFTENLITVPKIIEYPPNNYRNYFIEKTSVPGHYADEMIHPATEGDRTSDYIDVRGWDSITLRIRFYNMNGAYSTWTTIHVFDENKNWVSLLFEGYVTPEFYGTGDFEWHYKNTLNIHYIRFTTTYYDTPGVTVKTSIERGDTNNLKHYLAPEDMPDWVIDTGHPISIFPEGIVIKGDLI